MKRKITIRWLLGLIWAIRRLLRPVRGAAPQGPEPRTDDRGGVHHEPAGTMPPLSNTEINEQGQAAAPATVGNSPAGNCAPQLTQHRQESPGGDEATAVVPTPEGPSASESARPYEPATTGNDARDSTDTSASSGESASSTSLPIQPDQQFPPATPKRRVSPEKRGGRPRQTGATPVADSSTDEQTVYAERRPRPELVCWRQGMNWAVGVEVDERSTEDSWNVTGTSILTEDEQRPGRWVLTRPLDGVDLVRGDGEESFSFPGEPFRVFKLVGAQRDRGRHLKSLTRGRFLVVTPLDWERHAESAGHEIVAPEYVMGASYRAHHLEVSDPLAGLVVFDTPGGHVALPAQSGGFELEGDRLGDAHPEAGPLFRGSPPQLRSVRNIAYTTVVVGEEGPREGTSGWRARAADFEALRPRIMTRRAGWFFVRLYDANDDLIDSLNFRFSAGLQAIKSDGVPPVPAADGHSPARFRLVCGADCEVRSADTPVDGRLLVTREQDDSYRIEIPPLPDCDETRWTIRERNGAEVEICLRVDRLWWSVVDEASASASTEWNDRQLELRAEELAATSRRILRVRTPSFAREVRVGLAPDRCLALRPIAGCPRETQIPLRDLGRFSAANAELKLWISPDGSGATRHWEVAVGRICAPQRTPEPGPPVALWLHALNPVPVMTVLTRVRHRCGGRHKKMIDLLRRAHYNPGRHSRHRDRAKRDEFLCRALCILAVIIEEHAGSNAGPLVAARWVRRAQLARTAFPTVFEDVKVSWPRGKR